MNAALANAAAALADFADEIKAQGGELPTPSAISDWDLQSGEMVACLELATKQLVRVAAVELEVSAPLIRSD